MDANFKLKGKERGIKDFELDPGWGSYVQNERYQAHVEWHVDQPEVIEYFPSDVWMAYLFHNKLTPATRTMMLSLVQTLLFQDIW